MPIYSAFCSKEERKAFLHIPLSMPEGKAGRLLSKKGIVRKPAEQT
jgi:hypothetical protein